VEEEIEEKDKANLRRLEQKSSEDTVEPLPDVCETPSPPAGPVPIPYPNIAKSSDSSSGSKTVKTEGKMVSAKEDFEKSVGDEAGTSDGESEIDSLKEAAKTKVLGVPLWIWGLLVIAVLVIIWILSSNAPQPIEQY
jgi:cobalamin biosynthesis Mg chelatase CobN